MIDPSDQLDDLVEGFLAHLQGGGPPPDLTDLPSDVRSEAEARFEMLRAAHGVLVDSSGSGASRIAARFGLDRAGQKIEIAGAKVKRAGMSKKLQLADVAGEVQKSGVELSSAQLFQIETAAATPRPANFTALVAVLNCSVADLEMVDTSDLRSVRAFIDSAEFHELIASWAAEHDLDAQTTAGPRSGAHLLAAHYRAQEVTREQLREILRAILRKLDGRERTTACRATPSGHPRRRKKHDLADSPEVGIQLHFSLTIEAARSFAARGNGGWCDGSSITEAGIILYRPTSSRPRTSRSCTNSHTTSSPTTTPASTGWPTARNRCAS